MPLYEFKCKCGEVIEKVVDHGTKTYKCPKCGNEAKKIISVCGWSLKGEGWYNTTNPK